MFLLINLTPEFTINILLGILDTAVPFYRWHFICDVIKNHPTENRKVRFAESKGLCWIYKDLPPATTQGKTKKQNKPKYTWQILDMSHNDQLEGGQMLWWSGQDLKQHWSEWEQSPNTLSEPSEQLTWNDENKKQIDWMSQIKRAICPVSTHGKALLSRCINLGLIRFSWGWGFLEISNNACNYHKEYLLLLCFLHIHLSLDATHSGIILSVTFYQPAISY